MSKPLNNWPLAPNLKPANPLSPTVAEIALIKAALKANPYAISAVAAYLA